MGYLQEITFEKEINLVFSREQKKRIIFNKYFEKQFSTIIITSKQELYQYLNIKNGIDPKADRIHYV